MQHIAPYLSLHLFFLVFLSARVIRLRRREQIGVGVGNSKELALADGVFENYVEYTPFFFLISFGLYSLNAPPWLLHTLSITFTVARGLHFWGYSRNIGVSFGRFYGMVLTFLSLIAGALALLALSFLK